MKIEFSLINNREDYIWINNLATLDIVCSDGEATEIIIDDILSTYSLKEVPSVLSKLISKLKRGGTIVLYFVDIEIMAKMLTLGSINFEMFNDALTGIQPIKTFLETDFVVDILNKNNVRITKTHFKTFTSIIVGEYQ